MHELERRSAIDQAPSRAHLLGHRLSDAVDGVEGGVDEPAQLQGVDPSRRGVDRHTVGAIPLERRLAVGLVVEELVLRVGELQPLTVGPDRADEEAPCPGQQLALVAVGAEEGDIELVAEVIGQHDREHLAAAVAHRP